MFNQLTYSTKNREIFPIASVKCVQVSASECSKMAVEFSLTSDSDVRTILQSNFYYKVGHFCFKYISV